MKKGFGIAFTTLSWWICVLTGRYLNESSQYMVLIPFVLVSIFIHWKYYQKSTPSFFYFYLSGILIGLGIDGLFVKMGFLIPTGESPFPLWLLSLWLVFPLNFLHTLKSFTTKPLISGLFGLIGGPLAYKAGPAFGILELEGLWWVAEGAFWAFYMIAMGRIYQKLEP